MREIGGHLAPLLVLAATLSSGILQAQQTLVIMPTGYINVAPGGTIQFTAQITSGPGNSATGSGGVKWSIGMPGSNDASYGTISATGLYTAPATMGTAGSKIQINATSTNPNISATTFVYLLNPGPTITAVLPNPLPIGSGTVTIQGSGFQAGAVVFNGDVQWYMGTTTANSVQASGYQGTAMSATFYVRNPGSVPSNSITVPVTANRN